MYDKIAAKKAGTSYVSNDESVAVVDEYGVITAKAPGEAMITATAWDGAQASVRVLVNEPCKTFYYVALNGSDETGDGSIEHPFATVEKGPRYDSRSGYPARRRRDCLSAGWRILY